MQGKNIVYRVKNIVYRVLYGLIAVVFGVLFLRILFHDPIHGYSTLRLLLWFLCGGVLVIGAYFLLHKFREKIEAYYVPVLSCFLVLYGALVLYLGFKLRFTPEFDMDAIYGGAIEWLEKYSFTSYYEYFCYFPNNLGSMAFLYVFFGIASLFGVTDYFAVGIVVNSLLIVATVLTISLTCRKIRGGVSGVLALVVILICTPFTGFCAGRRRQPLPQIWVSTMIT